MQHWNRDSEVLHVGTALTRTLQGWCDTIVWETFNCKCSPYPSNQQDLEWRVIVFNVPPELDTDYFLPAIMDCSTLSSGSFHLFWAPLPCSVFSWPGSWRTKESVSCRESGANLFSIWLAAHYTIRPSSVILFIAMIGNSSAKRARPQRFSLTFPHSIEGSKQFVLLYRQISTILPRGVLLSPVSTRSVAQLVTTKARVWAQLLGIQLSLCRASFTALSRDGTQCRL